MAIHSGEVRSIGDGYVGMALHAAARLCAAAHGGQVLISEEVRSLVPTRR